MKIKTRSITFFILAALLLSQCSVVQQASEMQAFTKCQFRLKSVKNLNLAGVNVQEVDELSDLGIMEATKIMTAAAGRNLPLKFTLNVEVKNPNSSRAALNELDWILFIDDIEMTRGVLSKRVEIPPDGGISALPIDIGVDLFEVLSSKSADALVNFGLNLAGTGSKPTRIMLKAKPTIYIAGRPVAYPGYINIRTEFTSG